MKFDALQKALKFKNKSVSINSDLSPSIGNLLQLCYDSQPLTIENAKLVAEDSDSKTITIAGTSTFLHVVDLPVTGIFSLDEAEEVQGRIKYALPGDWKFSTSFPHIPTGFNFLPDSIEASNQSLLDTLNLSNSFFVVTTKAQADLDSHVDLEQGINFVGQINLPDEILAIFSEFVSSKKDLKIYGSIHIPTDQDTIPALQPLQRPWDLDTRVPGINLKVKLELDFKVGQLSFNQFLVRIYSPHAADWLDRNSAYEPEQGFTAAIAIPSADVQAVISAASVSTNSLLFRGTFQGAKLKKLAELIDISGSDSLASYLPEQLKDIERTLAEIELISAAVMVVKDQNKITASGTYFTIGLPHITWQVWKDHFQIQDIFCAFSVQDPFGSALLTAQITGTCVVENQPIRVFASTAEQFTVYAELEEHATIPLKNLLHTYVPEIPPPSDLTIDSLSIAIAPYKSYSMALVMAQDADAWCLDLGSQQLAVQDVNLSLIYPNGGAVKGSVSGSIHLGEIAQISVAYSIPGNIELNGKLPKIKLTELAREIAGKDKFYFPDGFPEVELVNSDVFFTRESQASPGNANQPNANQPAESSYVFRLNTTITIDQTVGLNLAATVLKDSRGSGFAAGIWTTAWSEGWSPGTLWKPLSILTFEQIGLFFCSIAPAADQINQIIPTENVPAIDRLGTIVQKKKFKLNAGVTFFTTLKLSSGSVEVLQDIFGNLTFDLFASITEQGSTSMIAHLDISHSKGIFEFDGFFLDWATTDTTNVDITANTSGRLTIDSESLNFDLGGTLKSDATGELNLAINDWVHPFGYQKLTIKNFQVGIVFAGKDAGGVSMTLSGSFNFVTKTGKYFTFGVAGAITNFEIPTGLAFILQSENNELLKFGEIIEGITTIDVYDVDFGGSLNIWVTMIKIIDQILQIRQLEFWAVEVSTIQIDGKQYDKGFGLKGDIEIFGKPVLLDVRIDQKIEKPKFYGSAELPEAIKIGKVLSLTRTKQQTDKGPILQVASELDTEHQYYLFVAARVVLLDLIEADLYAEATNEGFKFLYQLEVGNQGNGAWASQSVWVLVNAKQLIFKAGFDIDFGFKDVTLGPLTIDGLEIIPSIPLPNLKVKATLEVAGNVSQGQFSISGSLDFACLGKSWHPHLSIKINLSDAPQSLNDVGNTIKNWLITEPRQVFEEILKDFDKFINWAKEQFDRFKEKAAEIAKFMQDQFNKAKEEITEALKTVGYALDEVIKALQEGLNLTKEEAEELAKAAFTYATKCAIKTAASLL